MHCASRWLHLSSPDILGMAAEVDKTDAKEIEVNQTSTKPEDELLSTSGKDQKETEKVLEEVSDTALEKDPNDDHTASTIAQNNSEVEFVKKPGEFTTEVFKIEIRNLPRYAGYKVTNTIS